MPSTLHLSAPGLPVLLGLLAAVTWGAADFAGGLATRRTAPSRVVLIAHGVSLLLLTAVTFCLPVRETPLANVAGILSGIVGGAALMIFYEALALGAMGLSAALAGLLTALLPVLLGLRTQGLPGSAQLAGFALAAIAIVLIAWAPAVSGASRTPARALTLSTIAGVGFGLQLIWLHASAGMGHAAAGSPAPVLRALTLSRLGGAGIALAVRGAAKLRNRQRPLRPAPGTAGRYRLPVFIVAVLAGLLDTAGNGLYMTASLLGRLDVAAVLSSLYPGGTILLAALLLKERASRVQALGMGLALAAVVLIAA